MVFLKGSYIEPSDFAYKTYWKALHDFLGHMDHVSKRRWGLILEFKKEAAHDKDDDYGMDELMISAYHEDLYIPSSPQKA